jgi:hypothetical protein
MEPITVLALAWHAIPAAWQWGAVAAWGMFCVLRAIDRRT